MSCCSRLAVLIVSSIAWCGMCFTITFYLSLCAEKCVFQMSVPLSRIMSVTPLFYRPP